MLLLPCSLHGSSAAACSKAQEIMALGKISNLTAHAAAVSTFSAAVCPPVKRSERYISLCMFLRPSHETYRAVQGGMYLSDLLTVGHIAAASLAGQDVCRAASQYEAPLTLQSDLVWVTEALQQFDQPVRRPQGHLSKCYSLMQSAEQCRVSHMSLTPIESLAAQLQRDWHSMTAKPWQHIQLQ